MGEECLQKKVNFHRDEVIMRNLRKFIREDGLRKSFYTIFKSFLVIHLDSLCGANAGKLNEATASLLLRPWPTSRMHRSNNTPSWKRNPRCRSTETSISNGNQHYHLLATKYPWTHASSRDPITAAGTCLPLSSKLARLFCQHTWPARIWSLPY